MAEEPPDLAVEGMPLSHATQKSFAATLAATAPAFSGPVSTPCPTGLPPPISGSHKGFPSINFKDSAIQDLSKPFGWSIIGKFAHGYNKSDPDKGRPPTQDIHKFLLAMDFKGGISVGLLDNRHVWIRFSTEEDFLRLYSRPIWHIGRAAMRIFKWTPYFRVDIESSLVPVWVSFPRLPVQFFHKKALHPIASLLGLPLRPDTATISLKRPSVARIQIELDLLKPRHDKIWIEVGSAGGFWQKVEYESIPHYCTHCMHVGHQEQFCTVQHPDLKTNDAIVQNHGCQKHVRSNENRKWTPKQNNASAVIDNNVTQPPVDASPTPIDNIVGLESSMQVGDSDVVKTVKGGSMQSNPANMNNGKNCSQPTRQNDTEVATPAVLDAVISSPTLAAPIPDIVFIPPVSDVGISPSSLVEGESCVQRAIGTSSQELAAPVPVAVGSNAEIPPISDAVLNHPIVAAPISDAAFAPPEPDPARVIPTESVILNASEDEENLVPTDPPIILTSSSVYPTLQSPVTYGTLTSPIQTHTKFAVLAILQSCSLSMSRRLNVEAEAWFPDPRVENTGRILPPSLAQNYENQNWAMDYVAEHEVDASNTLLSGEEEDEEDEDHDSMEDYLDRQSVRDDLFLEQRKTRQKNRERRDRDMVLLRRGRGRPLGSRTRTYFDYADSSTPRQSDRINKGVPPKHYDLEL